MRTKALSIAATLWLGAPALPSLAQAPTESSTYAEWRVEDFAVTYAAKVGIARGETRLELRRLQGNEFQIESWTELRGVVSWFKRGSIYEVARFSYVDGALRTHRFERRDDISSEDRNVVVDYDWAALRASITYQGKQREVPIEDGVSNTLVMQVALMQALSSEQRPDWLDVVGHKGRLRFDLTYNGPQAIEIDAATRTLFCYSHSRRDSGIRTTFWAEPALAHLPLKARIEQDDKLRGQLTLVSDTAVIPAAAAR